MTPLESEIRRTIAADGPIPVAQFMALALGHPAHGYYVTHDPFGVRGDFITAPEISQMFGELVGLWAAAAWTAMGRPGRVRLVELGPGRGTLMADALRAVKVVEDFCASLAFDLVEMSPLLRQRQEQALRDCSAPLHWHARFADVPEGDPLIVIANEFFDALPVEIIDERGTVRVAESNGKFTEQFIGPSAEELEFLDRYGVHPDENGRVEVSLASVGWMERIAATFQDRRGFAVLIDYGYTRQQQLAGRHRDTLMTYRRHRAGFSPYDAPGEQDITAHVNFTALSSVAESHSLELVGLLTQSQFLIGIGEESQFADAFEGCQMPQERAKVTLQLKHLISPEGMGEVFQVLVLSHGVDKEKAAHLSGPSFLRLR